MTTEWISVDDSKPKKQLKVIVWNDVKGKWKVDYWTGDSWYDSPLNEITHWIEITPPN